VIAWLEYYPSSRMFEALGMPGPRANSGRQCRAMYEPTVLGLMPSRVVYCGGGFLSSDNVQLSEDVSLDGVTRRLIGAARMWTVPDSAQWKKGQDSVALSLAHLGGQPYACVKGKGSFPQAAERKYWRFSGFYVRLVAHEWERDPPDLPRWILYLNASPTIPYECAHEPREPPSPEEGCNADAVIRLALPGNRVLCVKSWLVP